MSIPLFTAADLEPTGEEMAAARAQVAGRDVNGTNIVASSVLRVRMPGLLSALTSPYSTSIAAGDIRYLIAAGRACDERLDILGAELRARLTGMETR